MKFLLRTLAYAFLLTFSLSSFGQVNIGATLPSTITQNFDGLPSGSTVTWADNSTPLAGLYAIVTDNSGPTTTSFNGSILGTNTGTSSTANIYNYGSTSSTDRALGAVSSSPTTGSTFSFGYRLKNNSSSTITALYISYNGEQWRQNSVAQTMTFDYQIGTTVTSLSSGSWTSASAFNFAAPNVGTASALDGNLTSNRAAIASAISVSIPAGSEIMLRWTQAGSNSHGLAVDDLSVIAFAAAPTITVSTTSLDFEKVYTGFRSLPKSYTVSGTGLGTNVTITAPTGIELTTNCSGTYSSSVSLTPSGGTLSSTTVYARYTGGTVSANITHSSPAATTKNIAISEAANSSNVGTYYSGISGTGATLKTALYNLIKGHTSRTYTNLWTDFQTTDVKPDGSVWDMYTDNPCGTTCVLTYVTDQDGGTGGTVECDKYNREHSWPNSWFGGNVAANEASIAYTDLFHLIPTDKFVNNARGNLVIGEVTSPTQTFNNGGKIGPNDVSGSGYTTDVFEPIDAYKGDFARAYFYMVTRYQPDQAAWEAITTEGDVVMDGTTYPSIEPWVLTMLLNWNTLDPVDQKEMTRNDAIYSLQGNRNPFIDHPEYVAAVWVTSPTLSVSPSSITGLTYILGAGPSASQSITLSGSNLTGYPGNITITAPTNFEVSTDNSSFASSKTVAYSSATLSNTTIYVRLVSGLSVNTYSGTVTLSGGGDSDGASVSVSGSVTSVTPTLSVSPSSLSGLTYISGAGPSASQSFNLSGTYLTGYPGNITITAPTNFEVSTDNSSFASSKTIAYSSATLSSTTIYVRLSSGLSVNTYSGSVTLSGGGDADGASVSVSGSVTSGGSSCGSESFTNIPTTSSSSYLARTWTGDDGNTWSVDADARTDQTITGKAITIRNGTLTSPTTSGGIANLTFQTKFPFSESSGSLTIKVNSSTVGTVAYADMTGTTPITKTITGINVSGNVTVTITSATARFAIDDLSWTCYSSTPVISVSTPTLTGFSYIYGNGPSTEKTFTVSGSNLTTNISLSAPTDYEISTTSGSGFGTSLTLTQTGGTVSTTTIYVRLKAGLSAGNYNSENITTSSTGATSQTVACSGTVTTPTISLSTSSLSGFSYNVGSGPSGEQSFTASGTSLTANISISTPANYEISTTSGSGFGSSVTLTQSGGTVSTTTIYVRLKAGLSAGSYNSEIVTASSTGASSQTVTCSGTVNALTPTINISTATLSGFAYVVGAGPSSEQTFTASGSNLTANISISAPTDYEISTTSGSGFGGSLTLTQSGGTVSTTTIYVRLKAGLAAASYNSENITLSSTGATSQNVACSGTVSSGSATIAVSSTTLSSFTYTLGAGPSTVQSYTISGTSLSGSGNITVTGSTNYEVSTDGSTFASSVTYAYAGGVITGQPKTVYVRLKTGLAVNTYNGETITNAGGGATTVNVTCSGSVTTAGSGCATDLIISEYVEGSSNNKYIEIYNNTGASVNLANYKLRLFANGAATPSQDIALSGTLNNQTTIVYKNSSATIYGGTCTSNAAVAYNGNDAVALYKVSTSSYVDIFGRIGEDPGTAWTGGSNTTLDKTLVRNASVITGVSTNPTSGFPTLATEWTQYNIDAVSNLGSHIMSCDITWVGATSTDWSVATNWNNNVVPSTQDVTIPSSPVNQPQVTAASNCRNLIIKPGASLTINAAKTLSVGGNFLIQSDATGTGSFIDLGTLTVTGTTTVQKYLPNGRWWYLGSPMSNATGAAFGTLSGTNGTGNRLYSWGESAHAYTAITNTGTTLTQGTGYAFKRFDASTLTASYAGTLNTGAIGTSSNLSYTAGTSSGYNLVCNPYPSAININSTNISNSSITPTNLTGSLWYRTNSTFATYNWNTGVGTTGAWGTASGVIPAMQAFWVRTNGSAGGLQFTNASRLHNAQVFYKEENENNIFRIRVSDADDIDEAVIGFYADAIDGYDAFDSDKMFAPDASVPQLYTLTTDNTIVAINGQSELLDGERVVPLGFTSDTSGMFTLTATNLDEFDPFIDVYLEDQLTGNFQDMRNNNSYSFTSGVVSNNSRFMLHFGAVTTGIGNVSADEISIYAHASSIYINMPTIEKGQFELCDLFGKIVSSREIYKGYTKINIDLPVGIYTVKVVTGDKVNAKKVVIE